MLTDNEKLFCTLYAQGGNMEMALAESNVPITYPTAVETGYNLLKRDDIQAELSVLKKDNIATEDEVMNYLTNVLRGTSQTEENIVYYEQRGMQKIKKVRRTPNEQERLKSAQLLLKMMDSQKVVDEQPVVFMNDLPEEEIIDVEEVSENAEPVHNE